MCENNYDINFNKIINSLKAIDEVDAVALGGSRATGANDPKSDYDIYVYCSGDVTIEQKTNAIAPYCSETEIGNHYWELEDNCVMKNGVAIDIIYRKIDMFEEYLNTVIDKGFAFNGYTTCFWHNIITCKVLFDKSGKFTELANKYNIPYPEQLRANIIEKNRKLLSGVLPSYDEQIKKAESRGDLVSVHHRTTEFLASYFDIIFAYNRVPHPGEKRLISLCKEKCETLPQNFEENITALLNAVATGGAYEIVCEMVSKLDDMLNKNKI